MLHDIDFGNNREARFFRAVMLDGVIEVPPLAGAIA
jgi:CRISPR-associated protein Cas5d